MKHTPTPWMRTERTVYALNENGFNRFFLSVQDAYTDPKELEANAALIVLAVNNHEKLVKALREMTAAFENRMGDWENADFHDCYNNAVSLLAQIEKG